MAGNFVSPTASTKMKVGKANRPKRTAEDTTGLNAQPRTYPITDSFASREIPGFKARRRVDNPKTGWNTKPTHASISGAADFVKVSSPERGRGKTVGKDE
jgi:hypothetical protein